MLNGAMAMPSCVNTISKRVMSRPPARMAMKILFPCKEVT